MAKEIFSEGILCKLCKKTEENLFDLVANHRERLFRTLHTLCEFRLSHNLCKYFVDNQAAFTIDNSFDFIRNTEYYCANVLKLCDKVAVEYDFEKFKEDLYKNYPIAEIEKNKIQAKISTFNALVLNDIHIQNDYEYKSSKVCPDTEGGCCSRVWGFPPDKEKQALYWGTPVRGCDIPYRTFDQSILEISKQVEEPDFVFILGDYVGHNYFRESPQILANTTEYIFNSIQGNFTKSRVVPVLGNHECNFVDYQDFSDPDNFENKEIFPLFEKFIPKEKVSEIINKGYYSLNYEEYNLKIISMNSQMNDVFNMYLLKNNTNPLDFFTNLANELYESEKKGEKVIILSHIPPSGDFSIFEFNRNYIAVIQRFNQTVLSSIAGHSHHDQLLMFKDEKGEVFHVNYINPSLTTDASHNPSIRLMKFKEGEVQDYDQYSFDIDKFNKLADNGDFKFEIKKQYSFKEEYEIKEITRENMKLLEENIKNNKTFTEKYVKNYHSNPNLIDWEKHKNSVLCDLIEDINEKDICNSRFTFDGISPIGVYRYLFVKEWLVKK